MPVLNANEINDISVFPTGMFLDELTGRGGMIKGRCVEFWGEQDSGKSTAALQVIAAAQRLGDKCLLIDTELSYTNEYAEKLRVDTAALHVLRGLTAEEILDEAEALIKAGKYNVVVMDSLGRLSSRISFEKPAGERTIGTQASLIKEFLTKVIPYILLHKICFIGISHLRKDMEWGKLFTLGGNRWHEARKLSIRFKPKSYRKQGEEVIGTVIEAIVTKNHVSNTTGKVMTVFLAKDEGFSTSADALDAAIAAGKFERKGNTFYTLSGEKIGTMKVLREWWKENQNNVP